MKGTLGNTAILVFTRTDEQEASAKTFVQGVGRAANVAIAQHLIHHTLGTALKTGLPVIISMGSDQVGETFGERFAHAIEGVFAVGYENVVTIGNDCPSLTPSLLLGAAKRLETNGLALGPAMDGGVYLVGISKSCFDLARFTALPWETIHLQAGLQGYAEQLTIATFWLPIKIDIDNGFGFFIALSRLGYRHQLRKKLMAPFNVFQQLVAHSHDRIETNLQKATNELRGPPAYFTVPVPPVQ